MRSHRISWPLQGPETPSTYSLDVQLETYGPCPAEYVGPQGRQARLAWRFVSPDVGTHGVVFL